MIKPTEIVVGMPVWREPTRPLIILVGPDAQGKSELVCKVREGGWGVFQDPENGQHPALQRKFARSLARKVRGGARLVVSTNSDYIVRELSNLIRLGERGPLGRQFAKEHGYDPGTLLRAKDVGVWLVVDGMASPLKVDKDGFSDPSIDEVIDALNQDTQAICFDLPEEAVDQEDLGEQLEEAPL